MMVRLDGARVLACLIGSASRITMTILLIESHSSLLATVAATTWHLDFGFSRCNLISVLAIEEVHKFLATEEVHKFL